MSCLLGAALPALATAQEADVRARAAQALHDLASAERAFGASIDQGDLLRVHRYDTVTGPAVAALIRGKALARSGEEDRLFAALLELSRVLVSLHDAVHSLDQPRAAAERVRFAKALAEVERFYPDDVLRAARAIPDTFSCPMHPDVSGAAGERCPRCGMPMLVADPAPSTREGVATVSVGSAGWRPVLSPGQATEVRFSLRKRDGSPLVPDDLLIVHTRRIHLFVIDRSLADYHHEHPDPGGAAGDYVFRFTPQRPGPYRVFVDLLPWESGRPEQVWFEITSPAAGLPVADRTDRDTAVVDGLTYRLTLEDRPVHAGRSVRARLRVTAADGKPFTALEPVMGAFAHLVGFREEGGTVLHSHPLGAEARAPTPAAGPRWTSTSMPPSPGSSACSPRCRSEALPATPASG